MQGKKGESEENRRQEKEKLWDPGGLATFKDIEESVSPQNN